MASEGLDSLSSAAKVTAASGPSSSVSDSDDKPGIGGDDVNAATNHANTGLAVVTQAVVCRGSVACAVEGTLGAVATEAGDSPPVGSDVSDAGHEHTPCATTGDRRALLQEAALVACDETEQVGTASLPEESKVVVETKNAVTGLDKVDEEKHATKSENYEVKGELDDAGCHDDEATMYCEESVPENRTVPKKMLVSVCNIDIFVLVLSPTLWCMYTCRYPLGTDLLQLCGSWKEFGAENFLRGCKWCVNCTNSFKVFRYSRKSTTPYTHQQYGTIQWFTCLDY